jgi:hypothetical protein
VPWEQYDYSTQNGNRIAGITPQKNVSSTRFAWPALNALDGLDSYR